MLPITTILISQTLSVTSSLWLIDAASSSGNWTAVMIALPPTIAALAAAYIGIQNAKKTAVIAEKTVQMEQQGNSRWGEQEKKLDAANRKADDLQRLVTQLLPGAREAGVKEADAKGRSESPAPPKKSGPVGPQSTAIHPPIAGEAPATTTVTVPITVSAPIPITAEVDPNRRQPKQ